MRSRLFNDMEVDIDKYNIDTELIIEFKNEFDVDMTMHIDKYISCEHDEKMVEFAEQRNIPYKFLYGRFNMDVANIPQTYKPNISSGEFREFVNEFSIKSNNMANVDNGVAIVTTDHADVMDYLVNNNISFCVRSDTYSKDVICTITL